ncbi:MAG: YceI family protein [Gammaproteobacteria bacterium]|jgi:hypothetical protein|nr:YceI family protein [Gammaproteobacteria bacterium]MBT6044317.1 YceI family protein [Gammaproteobacteria bacterium]
MFTITRRRFPIISSFVFILLTSSQSGFAAWTLNQDDSALYYITSKAAAVSELNSFTELSGSINDAGNGTLAISLSSVDTAVDIRNERMRDIVFQVANYPIASISVQANGAMLAGMSAGETVQATFDAVIELHGIQQNMPVELAVNKQESGGLLVVLAKPLIINAASFGLAESVEQLREIAGLPSINNNVVVDFTLQFDAAD